MKSKKGFTLIELMVVMAIIAVLSVLIIAAINIARQSSRNTTRQADAKTFQAALEAYYGANPSTGYPGTDGSVSSVYDTTSGTPRETLNTYLSSFPASDPSGQNNRVQYCRKSKNTYNLYVVNEPPTTAPTLACDPSGSVTDFSVK